MPPVAIKEVLAYSSQVEVSGWIASRPYVDRKFMHNLASRTRASRMPAVCFSRERAFCDLCTKCLQPGCSVLLVWTI